MGKSLVYKDNRRGLIWSEFSDARYNLDPVELTTVKTATRSDGEYVYDQMEIKTMMTLFHQFHRDIRELKQRLSSAEGQLEYITKNGVEAYTSKIQEIKDLHPKPTE